MIVCNPQLNQQTEDEDNIQTYIRSKETKEISFRCAHLEFFSSSGAHTPTQVNICPFFPSLLLLRHPHHPHHHHHRRHPRQIMGFVE